MRQIYLHNQKFNEDDYSLIHDKHIPIIKNIFSNLDVCFDNEYKRTPEIVYGLGQHYQFSISKIYNLLYSIIYLNRVTYKSDDEFIENILNKDNHIIILYKDNISCRIWFMIDVGLRDLKI